MASDGNGQTIRSFPNPHSLYNLQPEQFFWGGRQLRRSVSHTQNFLFKDSIAFAN
jgi:hypothetical protein